MPSSNFEDSETDKRESIHPVSFSQRLRQDHMSGKTKYSDRSKPRAASLTAFERAKIMMRLRGGDGADNDFKGLPTKHNKRGSSQKYENSGK